MRIYEPQKQIQVILFGTDMTQGMTNFKKLRYEYDERHIYK